MPKIERLVAVW